MTEDPRAASADPMPGGRASLPATAGAIRMFWEASADLMLIADRSGVLQATNPAWRLALGRTGSEAPVQLVDLVHEQDRSTVQALLDGDGQAFEACELRMRTTTGGYRKVQWNGLLDGQLWYASGTDRRRREDEAQTQPSARTDAGVATDGPALRRAEAEAVTARNHLRAVTDSMTEGLFALDRDGRVTLMNQAAEDMLGWPLARVRGQRLHDITRHHRADGHGDSLHDCTLGGAVVDRGVIRVAEDVFVRRDGVGLPVAYTTTPLEADGRADGFVVVFMDASHILAEQERLQRERSSAAWVARLRETLDEGRLLLYAQPIVEVSTMTVVQRELLLRVAEKDGTISPPVEYLETAEEHGLIGEIDRWVIRQAIDLAATGLAVEVNVSASSIGDETLLVDVERWLLESGADPSRVVFEITETAVIADEQVGRRFVDLVHRLGCKVALDDFGTGYSGFAYLKQLPVDSLKIDIEFVRDLSTSSASRHVVEAVVNLARGFGLTTVAEGVEDADTLELLIALGVDHVQGFHLGLPAPLRPSPDLMDSRNLP